MRGAPGNPSKWVTLAIVGAGGFMASLDTSIVNISLPAIARHFGVPLSGAVEWVVIAYLLMVVSLLLTIGRLADMLGPKPIWLVGLLLFTLGSALCGAAPSLPALVGFRAFQGLGGAMLMAISPALLTGAFPASERGRALGFNAVIAALGVSTGPTLGGLLTHVFSWRAVFYVNVPVGLLAASATAAALRGHGRRGGARFDPAGASLLALGVGCVTLGLSYGQEWGWGSTRTVAALVLGAAGLVALVLVERVVREPVLDLSLFRRRLFAAASVSKLLSFFALFSVSFLMPFYLEDLRGLTTLQSGLMLTPLSLATALVAPISGSVADRIGTRLLTTVGLAIACLALVLVSTLGASTPVWHVILALVLAGVGEGMFQSPNNSALMGAAPEERQGMAAGMLATARVMGQSISVALSGAIFIGLGGAAAAVALRGLADAAGSAAPDPAALRLTFTHAFRAVALACAAIAAIGVLTSSVRGDEGRGAKPPPTNIIVP